MDIEINKKVTGKYIGDYLKKQKKLKRSKKSSRSRAIKIGSAASALLVVLGETAKLAKELLDELSDSDFNSLFLYPSMYPKWPREKYYSRVELSSGLYSLQRGGYVASRKDGAVELSEKGVKEILKYKMINKQHEKPWDGKWRVIIFDIKEATRKDRDYLRLQLKWIGFRELQKSVWVFPYEIREELREFIKLCKFKFAGDVRFLLVDEIDPDFSLRADFSLKE